MRVFDYRHELQADNVSDLSAAYRYLVFDGSEEKALEAAGSAVERGKEADTQIRKLQGEASQIPPQKDARQPALTKLAQAETKAKAKKEQEKAEALEWVHGDKQTRERINAKRQAEQQERIKLAEKKRQREETPINLDDQYRNIIEEIDKHMQEAFDLSKLVKGWSKHRLLEEACQWWKITLSNEFWDLWEEDDG